MPRASEFERIPLDYVRSPDRIDERAKALEAHYKRNPWPGLFAVIVGATIVFGPWPINASAFTAWLCFTGFVCVLRGYLITTGIFCLFLILMIVQAHPRPRKRRLH